jgi:hypothetical protein
VVNGVLKKGMSSLVIRLNGLVPDQTPVLDRKYSFMLKVMAAAEAYAMSLYSLTTPGMQGMSLPSNSRSERAVFSHPDLAEKSLTYKLKTSLFKPLHLLNF